MFLSQGQAGFYKLQSLYGLLRMLGASDGAALAFQAALTLTMAVSSPVFGAADSACRSNAPGS